MSRAGNSYALALACKASRKVKRQTISRIFNFWRRSGTFPTTSLPLMSWTIEETLFWLLPGHCGLECSVLDTLQLCISDAKKKVSSFGLPCVKSRFTVGHYKKSTRAGGRLLQTHHDMPMQALEVILDVPTRSNSDHETLARLLRLRAPIFVEPSS